MDPLVLEQLTPEAQDFKVLIEGPLTLFACLRSALNPHNWPPLC